MTAEQPQRIELTVEVEGPGKAVDLLSQHTGLSKGRIKEAMTKGAVWLHVEGRAARLRRASRAVRAGQQLSIYYDPSILDAVPPAPQMLADQQAYSVWYKPADLWSSGSRFGDHHALARWVEGHLGRPTLLVHRLDRATRGLMVVAHQKRSAGHLAQQFRARETTKIYQARVHGQLLAEVTQTHPIDGKPAVSHVRPHHHDANTTWVSVQIETGRKHQIRRHLAELGHPVVGDTLHGAAEQPMPLELVAVQLAFVCPQAEIPVEYRLPEDLLLF